MLNFGGFLSSNFWTNYRCTSSASIEDLLNNKDCSVDKLLDDDDCLQEFKNYNDKLIKYFDHDKLKTLIDYITVMPDKDDGHNRGRKYPFITGEIFNCEINQILDKFFEAPVKVKEVKADEKDEDKDDEDDDKESPEGKESDDNKNEDEDAEKPKEKEEETAKKEDADKEDADKDKAEEKQEDEADAEKTEAAGAKNLEDAEKEDKDDKAKEEEVAKKEPESSDNNPQDKSEEQASAEAPKTEAITEEVQPEQPKEKQEESKAEDDKDKNTQEPESEEQAKKNKESDGAKEPEEEETATGQKEASEPEPAKEQDDKDATKAVANTTQSVASTLVTEEGEPEEEEESKHVLLDRLFKFIRTEGDEQLNPVLSGYFCKLVSLLISRKQKNLVPYIFAPNSDVIEHMLKHIYQKSISEVLNKLLTQIDGDYEPEIMAEIKSKQQLAVTKLIDMLGPELSDEHNLNACTIIQDMFEIKEFYNIICKRESLTKIINFSTAAFASSTKTSKSCSLIVLNQIITNHIDRQKKKDQKGDDKTENTNDEDDDMVQHNSDDEDKEDTEASNPNSATVQTNILVDILKDKIIDIQEILRSDHDGEKTRISVSDTEFVPLGQQRLYTVELVSKMVQLKKEPIFTALMASKTFANIVELVKVYKWNNFLQLKVINLFEQVFNNVENEAFKAHVLEQTQITKSLAEMGADHQYEMESERKIRNGHMALVVSISNLLIKKTEAEAGDAKAATGDNEATTASAETSKKLVTDFLAQEEHAETWKSWVDGELKKSNDNNKRPLGGSVSSRLSEEDDKDDNNYDVQMEKIMARFTNFNQILSSGGSQEEDDDDEEDEATQDSGDKNDDGFDEDDDDKKTEDTSISSFGQSDAGVKLQKVNLIVPETLAEEYIDNTYWKIGEPKPEDVDVDALLAELEA